MDDLVRLLDTSARLLKLVGAPQAGHVEKLRLDILQDTLTRAIDASSARSQRETTSTAVSGGARQASTHRSAKDVNAEDGAPSWQLSVDAVASKLGTDLTRRKGRCAYSRDGKFAVCCVVSKEYPNVRYWWTIHRRQLAALAQAQSPYVAFACGTPEQILLIPVSEVESWLAYLNPKTQGDEEGWHIHIIHEAGRWHLLEKGRGNHVEITRYLI